MIAIVNRRNSDLVDKSDGVLYTSDGRDVEMSVASTKAFYAQVAAGFLLAFAIADAVGALDRRRPTRPAARRCATCPTRCDAVLAQRGRDRRGRAAARAAAGATGRSSATAPNRIAADEVRIKLSELCYKSIACDATEDKKHIDLSSEPLILVCAAGLARLERRRRRQGGRDLPGAQGRADRDRHRGRRARSTPRCEAIAVPAVHPRARRSCSRRWRATSSATRPRSPSTRRPARCARRAPRSRRRSTRRPVADDDAAPPARRRARAGAGARSSTGCAPARYDGHLEAGTAVRLASLLRYAHRHRRRSTCTRSSTARSARRASVVEDLTAALTDGDRGAHPPGRRDQAPGQDGHRRHLPLRRDAARRCRSCRRCSPPAAPRDGLSYRALRTLVDLDPAVEEVTGFTRYRIEGDAESATATIARRRPGRHRARDLRVAHRARPAPARHQAPRRAEREVIVARGPQRRPHDRRSCPR